MKKISLFIVMLLLFSSALFAQVGVNSDGSAPDSSAMLDVKSANKGFLLPRMTRAELNSISDPADGLLVYCIDCWSNGLGSLMIHMAGSWYTLSINCLNPPVSATHIPSGNQIEWKWHLIPDAIGYKWNTINDYSSAMEMNDDTTKTETGLSPDTTYVRFVWAYNDCGISTVTTLSQALQFLIGQSYGGGIIFYIDGTGKHGLIAATSDQSTNATWGCIWNLISGTSWTIGTGQTNTTTIINGCGEEGIAARICDDLVFNGYDDWFLPSSDELNQMYLQRSVIGGFAAQYYWSSTEYTEYGAMTQHFEEGGRPWDYKSRPYPVRAVRAFSSSPPGAPTASIHVPSKNQIIWNWNLVFGATGYKWNTINNYASATDMGSDTTKTETGLTCGSAYTRYAWAYNECGYSTPGTLTQTTLACWSCSDSVTIAHVAGTVAPVTKTVTYGTVTNIPGESSKCWITSNLGADHQATSVDDNTEASAGWYWQFNRQQGYKHDGAARTPNTTWITSIDEISDWIPANDPCTLELGNGWRLPTLAEWTNVDAGGGWTNWNGPWNSSLKMHAAGSLDGSDGSLNDRGFFGSYWSSSQYNNTYGWYLFFNESGMCGLYSNREKVYGFAARCLRE